MTYTGIGTGTLDGVSFLNKAFTITALADTANIVTSGSDKYNAHTSTTFTLADVIFAFSVDIASSVGKQLFGLDLLGDNPAAQALLQRLGENPNVRAIAATRDAGMPAFVAKMRARLQAAG